MSGKTILILGGGVGGIVTANALRQRLGSEHRIVIVDKRAEYIFTPSLLWVMVGWRQAGQIRKDLRRLVRPGVEIMPAEVQAIDPERGRVQIGDKELEYDYLVVALGADLAPETAPGFSESAHNFFDLAGAAGLWPALRQFQSGRVAVLVSAMPYKCPAAPYEAAIQPMPVAGPLMGEAVVSMLAAKGIGFHPNLPLDHIDAAGRTLVFKDGRQEPFDFLAGVPPHRPPPVIKESPLANEAGWVPVDKHTLATRFENVYAIGDVTTITLANGKPLPKAGTFAHAEAEAVAARIVAEIGGSEPRAEFDGVGYCWIEAGGGSAGFASGQFYAEPNPAVGQLRSGRLWHWGKVMFEQYWLSAGVQREMARWGLNLGAKIFGIPGSL
ncbi:MAG TPA: FAD/NAD(P)-binding oxidoreductase [Anaerolineae bacterium]